jgi:hypothetical protein
MYCHIKKRVVSKMPTTPTMAIVAYNTKRIASIRCCVIQSKATVAVMDILKGTFIAFFE